MHALDLLALLVEPLRLCQFARLQEYPWTGGQLGGVGRPRVPLEGFEELPPVEEPAASGAPERPGGACGWGPGHGDGSLGQTEPGDGAGRGSPACWDGGWRQSDTCG